MKIYKIIIKVSAYIFFLFMLFSGFPRLVNETKMDVFAGYEVVFAGKIAASIPTSICVDPLTCAPCAELLCPCEAVSANTIAPVFGTEPRSVPEQTFCAGVSFQPTSVSGVCYNGSQFTTGYTILGHSSSWILEVNDGFNTNFWCNMQ